MLQLDSHGLVGLTESHAVGAIITDRAK
jgi:hypothetical protein